MVPAERPACIILAGGLGTRLREKVQNLPKPMAPIGDRPFLDVLLGQVVPFTSRIILSVGYMWETIRDHFGDGARLGTRIDYAIEEELLGTGGAVANARNLIPGYPVLIMNGDSYCEHEPADFQAFHREKQGQGSIIATRVPDTSRYGLVEYDASERLQAFREKSPGLGGGFINAGLYLLEREVVQSIPLQKCSLERDIFPAYMRGSMYVYLNEGRFIDIGIPEDYDRACAPGFFPPGRHL